MPIEFEFDESKIPDNLTYGDVSAIAGVLQVAGKHEFFGDDRAYFAKSHLSTAARHLHNIDKRLADVLGDVPADEVTDELLGQELVVYETRTGGFSNLLYAVQHFIDYVNEDEAAARADKQKSKAGNKGF